MKKTSLFMLALGSLAVAALAKPAMRQADIIIRRRRGETLSGLPATMSADDMQAVAQESSMVADGAQAHEAPTHDTGNATSAASVTRIGNTPSRPDDALGPPLPTGA